MSRAIVPTALALFLSITLSGASRADFAFQTPAGISPGQSFNVVFYDSIGDAATSTNIADYSAAITSAASGINYSGGTIGSWSVIGATQTADGSAGLFGSNLPVYDLGGKLLASTGGVYQSIGPSPSIDQTGALFPDYPVWTGLIGLGIPGNSQYALGGGRFPSYGLSGYPPPAAAWGGLLGGSNEDTYSPANIRGLYGYAVFTSSVTTNGEKTWGVDSDGNASLGSNWIGGVAPGGVGDSATFSTIITAPRTVTLDADTTLGSLTFDSSISYTIAGTHVLTLQAAGSAAATINVSSVDGNGAHTISAPITLASNLNIIQNSTGTLSISGPLNDAAGQQINVSGVGSTAISGSVTLGNGTGLSVSGSGTLRLGVNSSATIGTGVTAVVSSGATLELAGSVSSLANGSNRVNITNNSDAPGVLVSGTNQQVGNIDGSGTTQVNAGSDLTANYIIQSALVIGGASGNPGLVTIDASDGLGNPLASASALPKSLASIGSLGVGPDSTIPFRGSNAIDAVSAPSLSTTGGSSAVPEPSGLVLLAVGAIAVAVSSLRALRSCRSVVGASFRPRRNQSTSPISR
jgi:hypothetical protein